MTPSLGTSRSPVEAPDGELPARPADWHPLLRQVFQVLDDHGVEWCLLRPPNTPAEPTGDVDLLVHPRHRAGLPALLEPLGFAPIPDAFCPHLDLLTYDPASDCWVHLQFASELSFGPASELTVGDAVAALARRSRVGGMWTLPAEDELWVTLTHAVLDKGEVRARYRPRLSFLAAAAAPGGIVAEAVAPHLPQAWTTARVQELVRAARWAEVDEFAVALRAHWLAARGGKGLRDGVRFASHLLRGLGNPWRRRGVSVALLGPDGAGKSTLAAALEEQFPLGGRSFYMDVKAEELGRVAALRVPGLTFAVYLLRLGWRLAQARARQARGELVIFDRYKYDALHEDPAKPRGRVDALARWLHTHSMPDTAVGLVLDVPGERMFARKGERDPEDLERERRRWLELADALPNLSVIDATRSADEVRRAATAIVWAEYARRWRGRGAGRATPTEGR